VNRFQLSTLEGVLVRIAFAETLAAGAKGPSRGDDASGRRKGTGLSDLEYAGHGSADAVVSRPEVTLFAIDDHAELEAIQRAMAGPPQPATAPTAHARPDPNAGLLWAAGV
jgi:hypothetical protein